MDEAAEDLGTTAQRLLNMGVLGQVKLLAPMLNPADYAWTPDEDEVEWGLGLRKLDLTVRRRFGLIDRVFLRRDDLAKIEARGWVVPKKFSAPMAAHEEFCTWEAHERERFGPLPLTAHERYFLMQAFHKPWQLIDSRGKPEGRSRLKLALRSSKAERTTLKHLFIPIEEVHRLANRFGRSLKNPAAASDASRMLPLHEAQALLGGVPDEFLLHKAAEGETAIWIKVPQGYEVYGANREMQGFAAIFEGPSREPRSQDEGEPFAVNADYLSLSPGDCAQLLGPSTIVKRGFPEALAWRGDSWGRVRKLPEPSLYEEQEPWTLIEQFFLRSTLQSCDLAVDQFEARPVDRSCLYVLASEIEPHRSTISTVATQLGETDSLGDTRDDEFDDLYMQPHISEKLKTLIRLSQRWKDKPFNKNLVKDDYRAWHEALKSDMALQYNFAGRKELEKFAVELIRPLYARWSIPRGIDASILMDFRSPELRALVAASKKWEGWKAPAVSINKATIQAAIKDYMRARGVPVSNILLDHGPKIVQPEAADSRREKQGRAAKINSAKKQ
ncbi:hypothetical protein A6456_00050 [Paraburkholderia tropica]|nr:hypothetical protein A6456_00050 [Paraburkholderia tropica]